MVRFAATVSSIASFQVHRLPPGRPVILIPGEPALPVTLHSRMLSALFQVSFWSELRLTLALLALRLALRLD